MKLIKEEPLIFSDESLNRLFGGSERLPVGSWQLLLFNEAEAAETVNREPAIDFYLEPSRRANRDEATARRADPLSQRVHPRTLNFSRLLELLIY